MSSASVCVFGSRELRPGTVGGVMRRRNTELRTGLLGQHTESTANCMPAAEVELN